MNHEKQWWGLLNTEDGSEITTEAFKPVKNISGGFTTRCRLMSYFSGKNDTFKKQLREKYIPYLIYYNVVREEVRIDDILSKELDKIESSNISKNYLDRLVILISDKQKLIDERIEKYLDMIFEELNINDVNLEMKNEIVINVKKLFDKRNEGKSIVFPGKMEEISIV